MLHTGKADVFLFYPYNVNMLAMRMTRMRLSPEQENRPHPPRRLFLMMLGLLLSMPLPADTTWRTTDDVLQQYRERVIARLQPRFQFADVEWPPREISLVVLKDTRLMELWARQDGVWRHIKDYRVKGMSGGKGPKLREGDYQVPEGLYRIDLLNPNSAYHLSMRLNYPNRFDREMAAIEGREDLGGNIFIHGYDVSRGCLAMGNRAVEELFVLAAMLEESDIPVLISPRDFRFRPQLAVSEEDPAWIDRLNRRIARALQQFPLAGKL